MIDIDKDLIEKITLTSKLFTEWSTYRSHFQPILNSLEDFSFMWSPIFDGDLNFHFCGTGKDLARVWRAIRIAGFDTESARPQANSTSWTGRFYKEVLDSEGAPHELKIWVSYSSSICRKVQVGTRTEEVPIYETRCDDAEEQSNDFI